MLFRFQIELADVDRGLYESLDFRVAQHPSENMAYLLSRSLAFAHLAQEGLEFPPGGLGDPDQPAIRALTLNGALELWVDIGNPSARRMHKASKAAKKVKIYTYKNPELLVQSMAGEDIHRASEIEIYAFEPAFLSILEERVEKNNRWGLLFQDGRIDVDIKGESISSELRRFQ